MMISENKFIKYEVFVWLTGCLIRRYLAVFVFPYSSMATYETSKDICLLLNKIVLAKLVLKSHQGKELGQSGPTNIQRISKAGGLKDGNSQSR